MSTDDFRKDIYLINSQTDLDTVTEKLEEQYKELPKGPLRPIVLKIEIPEGELFSLLLNLECRGEYLPTIEVCGTGRLMASGNVIIDIYDTIAAKVYANIVLRTHGQHEVNVGDHCSVRAINETRVILRNNAYCYAEDKSIIHAYDNSQVAVLRDVNKGIQVTLHDKAVKLDRIKHLNRSNLRGRVGNSHG